MRRLPSLPRASRGAALVAALLLPLVPAALGAQRAGVAPSLALADSLAERGDSAAALEALTRAVRQNRDDAAAWYRRGMLAWTMARPRRSVGFMRNGDDIRRIALADSSLRIAVRLEPDSGRYALALARFFLNSNYTLLRAQAAGLFERAIEAARRANDSLLVAEAADEIGMVHWRRYEAVADRRNVTGVPGAHLDPYAYDPNRLRDYLQRVLLPPGGEWSGQLDYFKASDYFAEALRHNPTDQRALRHSFMALAERKRWEELREAASRRLGAAPWDALAWLALGLASQRMDDSPAAAAAFDSAMVLLPPEDVARYTRLSRLLRPTPSKGKGASDSAAFETASAARRARVERLYWAVSDPLAMTAENEHRLEFLARVAYAELRWTAEDFSLRGADTDRGDVYVRYGPPDSIYAFAPGYPEPGASLVLWTWRDGLSFVFRQPVTYGTARLSGEFIEKAKRVRETTPVRWGNVPVTRSLDSIPVQTARFRAPGDSTDFVVFAHVPIDSLVRGLDVRRGAVDVDFRVYLGDATLVRRDSTREMVEADAASEAVRARGWRERLPADAQLWRVEALQPDGRRAARAMGVLVRDTASGFGASDLLVAARVLPKESSAGARWSDFNVVPSVGHFRQGEPIGLLWETYGLAGSDDGSRYRVSLVLERTRREGALGVAARVVAGAGEVVGRTASGKGKISLAYDRTVPTRPVAVDHLTIDLATTPPGRYRLTLEVTDQIAKRTVRRERTIVIEP